MEEWRDIEGFEGKYQISNLGRVKSLKRYDKSGHLRNERIMKLKIDKDGYMVISLFKNDTYKSHRIHRLVATAFIPNPNNYPIINHKDENKSNNRVDNLEWCTNQYNLNYGDRSRKASISNSIPIIQFTKEGEFIRKWDGATQASRELNISQPCINECCKGKQKTCGGYRWRYYYKGIWIKKHVPLIKRKKVA